MGPAVSYYALVNPGEAWCYHYMWSLRPHGLDAHSSSLPLKKLMFPANSRVRDMGSSCSCSACAFSAIILTGVHGGVVPWLEGQDSLRSNFGWLKCGDGLRF